MSYISIDIDLDEVYDQMSKYDKQMMVGWLHDDGILDTHSNPEIRKMVSGDKE